MNFLNKAKETASKAINTENKGGSPMTNPFVKQNTINTTAKTPVANNPAKPALPGMPKPGAPTGTKPAIPGMPKPPVPGGAKPVIPGAKPAIPGSKPANPFNKPATPAPTPVEEVKEVETPAVPVEEVVAPVEEIKEAVVETVEEAVVETTEAVVAETTEAVVEEKKEPEVNEEELSPQQRAALTRKRNAEAKKKAEAAKKSGNASQVNDTPSLVESADPVIVPGTDLGFADCVSAIKSQFVDEEWEAFRSKVTTTMSEIMISNDMNKPQLHDLLAQVATLRDEICIAFNDTRTLYESLTSKEDGLIDLTKRLNGKGSNAEERKLSGTLAVMNYKTKEGHNINLYELLDETRTRYNFLRTIMDSIEFKKSVLLTMLSSLKMEK